MARYERIMAMKDVPFARIIIDYQNDLLVEIYMYQIKHTLTY